jgi:hypothetical protein
VDDAYLRLALSAIEPRGRELLRSYLIADQARDRDGLLPKLYRDRREVSACLPGRSYGRLATVEAKRSKS